MLLSTIPYKRIMAKNHTTDTGVKRRLLLPKSMATMYTMLMVKKASKHTLPLYKKLLVILAWIVGIVAAIAALIWVAFQVSPWPSALLLRSAFEKNAVEQIDIMNKYVPASGVDAMYNVSYQQNDKDALLDTYTPSSAVKEHKKLPTVIWLHGGGWISGNKANVGPYMKILAGKGYNAIAVNYSISPEKTYPTPILQLNAALAYVNQHADELHVDKNQIFLAGDSAGSQIAAQVATIITNPEYAKLMDMDAPIQASQLKGMLLNCGAYDLAIINTHDGTEGAKLLETFLWSYSGYKNFMNDPSIRLASVVDHVNKDFPPTFITAGNVDPLLPQSEVMAKTLQSLGVHTETLFYPANYTPALNHEYQFNLDVPAGQTALSDMESFLKAHTK
jgi:acetyl esterase